jgi:hypothetical protein
MPSHDISETGSVSHSRSFTTGPLCRGQLEEYMSLLVNAFNPGAAEGVMCRDTISVGWDGRWVMI